MAKKLQPIDYTSRDFDSIRRDLENFAKRYYPNTYKDFNKASFGSLMLDTVSYVGDILSFYLDYQANESFFETAVEYNNVVKLARQMGYKIDRSPSSYGILTFYVEIPSNSQGDGPDLSYAPILQQGSIFSSTGGGLYTLFEDVDFAKSTNQVVAGDVDTDTGSPLNYIIRAQGRAVSGRMGRETLEVGSFQKFLRVPLKVANVADVVSVVDSEGHRYYEVDHLSQNIIYKAVRNTDALTNDVVTNLLKATPVARRFVIESTGRQTYLQFGHGSDSELLEQTFMNPADVVLDMSGRNYTTDQGFDPSKLIETDKFGIAPANTTLVVQYRVNTARDVNAAVNTIITANRPRFKFNNQGSLSSARRNSVVSSLELTNEAPFVGDVALPSSEDVKQRTFGFFASQNRAVTLKDYKYMCYGMPAKFGSLSRVSVVRDFDEFKRNLNIYVMSEDTSGKLLGANQTLKNNLRNWIIQYKMVNDTVDILDASILNFGVNYIVSGDLNINRYTVINRANTALTNYFTAARYEIGESISITDIYKVLQKVPGVVDVVDVEIEQSAGPQYSAAQFDFEGALSADGRRVIAKNNIVFELKFPNTDIKGSIL